MKRRPFGSSQVEVPVIGQGTWKLKDKEAAAQALGLGIKLGMDHIDTAELYTGSEEVVGKAIRGIRDRVVLVSKVLPQNASFQGTLDACRKSLARLGTDHLDVYLLHWWGDRQPIEDTMRAMAQLVDDGRTRFVGVSNLDLEELDRAQSALGTKHRIVCNQVYYDLQHRHVETILWPELRKKDVALVGYSPFGSAPGSDPGGTRKGRQALEAVAARRGATVHQVALAFLTRLEGTFAIPKAERVEHVRANAAAGDLRLAPEDVAEIDAACPLPHRVEGLPMV